MRMKPEAKRIVQAISNAIAAATTYNPEEIRQATAHIRSPAFWAGVDGDAEEQAVMNAFVALLERSAERKDRLLQEAFGPKKASVAQVSTERNY